MATISALEISLESPAEVEINEEFTVKIDSDSTGISDVKIFVHKSEDTEIKADEYISEIYKDDWANPWYYIKRAFPDEKEYQIRVIESLGERTICARLRESETNSIYTECKPITIVGEETDTNQEEDEDQHEEAEEKNNEEENPSSDSPKETTNQPTPQPLSSNNPTNEKIILNSNPPTDNPKQTITTKQGKTRIALIYNFTGLCVVIIVLLALRKL
ncbi:MAG: hypothetical protein ABIG28_03270 [archaeon]